MTWYAYDWEFCERGPDHPIIPISLGMVASDGRELYLQNFFADWDVIAQLEDPWLRENVLPHLTDFSLETMRPEYAGKYAFDLDARLRTPWRAPAEMRDEVMAFIDQKQYGPTERLVGYFSDYDHVLLAQLFGRMIDLPKGVPMWTWDLKQWAMDHGIDWLGRLVSKDGVEHHALADARWVAKAYRYALEQG